MVRIYTDLHCFDQIQQWLDDRGVTYDREGGFNVLLTFPNQSILDDFIIEIEAEPDHIIPAD